MKKFEIEIYLIKEWQFAKNLVLGHHLYNPHREIQEHLKTMYFIGFILIIVNHKLKFKEVK